MKSFWNKLERFICQTVKMPITSNLMNKKQQQNIGTKLILKVTIFLT